MADLGPQETAVPSKAAFRAELSDALIDRQRDLQLFGNIHDTAEPGLRVYVGPHRVTWTFYADIQRHGKRRHIHRKLGRFDPGRFATVVGGHPLAHPIRSREPWHMGADAARRAAKIERGKVLEGRLPLERREQTTFAAAWLEYLEHLKEQAAERGKPPRWHRNVVKLGELYILPEWREWTLHEMSQDPKAVRLWHSRVAKKSAVSANHSARIVRAVYNRAAREDLRLNKTNPPTASITKMAKERGEQNGMTAAEFPEWFAAWREIPSPTRRSFHLVSLLCGARPGELGRTRWQDLGRDALVIGDAKAGNDIHVILTPEIRAALKLAADAHPEHGPADYIFPGMLQIQGKHRAELPAMGHALRRTFKTFASLELKIEDDVSAFLLGHAPDGMSARYVLKWALRSAGALTEAQHRISAAMMAALQGKPYK